jgi:hypothetical protein
VLDDSETEEPPRPAKKKKVTPTTETDGDEEEVLDTLDARKEEESRPEGKKIHFVSSISISFISSILTIQRNRDAYTASIGA